MGLWYNIYQMYKEDYFVYQLHSDYSPIYETLSSLVVFLNKKNHYDLDQKWVEAITKKAHPTVLKQMDDPNALPGLGYLHILIWKSPSKKDIYDFVDWLRNRSSGEIYEYIAPYIYEDFPKDLGQFRDYYVELLPAWVETYQIEEHIAEHLKIQTGELKQKLLNARAEDLIEEVTNGIYLHLNETISDIILVPSFHMVPLNRIYFLHKTVFITYAYDLPVQDPNRPGPQLLRMTKALGDEKRLWILKLIAHQPKTLTEIAKELGISNSNLHYHLSLLRIAGLVRIVNFLGKKSDLYTVRQGTFEKVGKELEVFVFHEHRR